VRVVHVYIPACTLHPSPITAQHSLRLMVRVCSVYRKLLSRWIVSVCFEREEEITSFELECVFSKREKRSDSVCPKNPFLLTPKSFNCIKYNYFRYTHIHIIYTYAWPSFNLDIYRDAISLTHSLNGRRILSSTPAKPDQQ